MPTRSRRDLIRRAVRAGVGVAGIAAVGCASPETYNSPEQRASDDANSPAPRRPPQNRQADADAIESIAPPPARRTSGTVVTNWCTRPSFQVGDATDTADRVLADPEVWRERYHWRTLPQQRAVAPRERDIALNAGTETAWRETAALDPAALLPLLHGQLIVLSAGDGIDAHRAVVEGDLAEHWEAPDAATIVFTLRDGLRWPERDDGPSGPLTATDAAAVHEAYRGRGQRQSAAYRAVAGIAADDDARTLTFSLSEPDASLLPSMTAADHIITPPGWDPSDPFAGPPGAGPFRVAEWSGPRNPWRFARSPDYFKRDAAGRPLPHVGGVRGGLHVEDGSSRGCAVPADAWDQWLGGIFDAAALRHPGEVVASLESIPGAVAQVSAPMPGRGWALEFPRNVKQPISDPRVRRAVSMAVDRELLAEQWEDGLAAPDCGMNWTLVEDEGGGFREWPWPREALGPSYRHQPQEVQDLLAAAGYSRQHPLRLSLLPGSLGRGFRTPGAFTRIGYLADALSTSSAGIIRAAPLTAATDLDQYEHHFNAESGNEFLAVPDANLALSDGSSLYPVTCDPTTYVPPDAQHRQDAEDPLVAELWQRQRRTIDPAERSQILEALRLRRAELMETVHLINRYGLHLRRPHVHNLVITAFAHHPIQQAKQLERTWLSAENGAG